MIFEVKSTFKLTALKMLLFVAGARAVKNNYSEPEPLNLFRGSRAFLELVKEIYKNDSEEARAESQELVKKS